MSEVFIESEITNESLPVLDFSLWDNTLILSFYDSYFDIKLLYQS